MQGKLSPMTKTLYFQASSQATQASMDKQKDSFMHFITKAFRIIAEDIREL